ncbi:MAG: hypothetical protein D6753_00345, partial [Planctomycetota bacterium]
MVHPAQFIQSAFRLTDLGNRHAIKSVLPLLLLLPGCWSGEPTAGGNLTTEELFRLHCSTCHGDGSGNGHVAQTLKVKPRDLRDGRWQQSVDDARIRRVIRDGGAAVGLSPEMPAFGEKLSG